MSSLSSFMNTAHSASVGYPRYSEVMEQPSVNTDHNHLAVIVIALTKWL